MISKVETPASLRRSDQAYLWAGPSRHHFAARGNGRCNGELGLEELPGALAQALASVGARGSGDRADPHRDPRAEQRRPGPKHIARSRSDWLRRSSRSPQAPGRRPCLRGLQLQIDCSGVCIGRGSTISPHSPPGTSCPFGPATTTRSFERKEDGGFALLHIEPHHDTPPTGPWRRRIRLRRYRRTGRRAQGTPRSEGAAS